VGSEGAWDPHGIVGPVLILSKRTGQQWRRAEVFVSGKVTGQAGKGNAKRAQAPSDNEEKVKKGIDPETNGGVTHS